MPRSPVGDIEVCPAKEVAMNRTEMFNQIVEGAPKDPNIAFCRDGSQGSDYATLRLRLREDAWQLNWRRF